MKSFVVMTYYQLMHSVAMALTLDEKPILYFSKSYLDIKEDLLDRIRQTGVFNDVIGITGRTDLKKFTNELKKTKDYSPEEVERIGNSLFEKHLEPYYAKLFKDADFNDTIYVYNDFQWHFYYIEKHFEHIVGIEDGYASLRQQLKIHRLRGNHELVEKFLGKYYPEPLYRSPKIHEIISSQEFDDIPDEYKEKLHVLNFNDLTELHFEQYKTALLHIFNIEDYEIEDGGVLFLSQPLSRALYCNPVQEYMMKRHILQNEVSQGKNVYFKAHPADTIDPMVFKDARVHILPGSFPVELLNYKGCRFEKVLSFGSTSVRSMACADSFDVLFPNQNASKEEINCFIKSMIKGETATLKVFSLVSDLTPEAYINVYSGFYPSGSNIKSQVTILVPPELKDEAQSYFDKKQLRSKISEYEKKHTHKGICILSSELTRLEKNEKRINSPNVLTCNDLNDEASVVNALKEDEQFFDFILIVHEKDPLFFMMKNIDQEYDKNFASCIAFYNYTQAPEKKMNFSYVPAAPGYINNQIMGDLFNKVWHRTLFNDLTNQSEADRVRIINKDYSSFARKFTDDLYVPSESYLNISNGCKYYLEKANTIAEKEAEDSDTMILLLAAVVMSYLDWLTVTNNKSNTIDELINQINVSDNIKMRILEAVCLTYSYENNGRYKKSANEYYVAGQYLRREIGMSEVAIRGAKKAKKMKSFRSKLKK